jgi:Berberine and berberine like/Crp-like helix-turn-helix domain
VGTVRGVVARILRELREEDLISTSRDKITLLDPTRLQERRLVELKRQWDPGNLFRLNQNIPPV